MDSINTRILEISYRVQDEFEYFYNFTATSDQKGDLLYLHSNALDILFNTSLFYSLSSKDIRELLSLLVKTSNLYIVLLEEYKKITDDYEIIYKKYAKMYLEFLGGKQNGKSDQEIIISFYKGCEYLPLDE